MAMTERQIALAKLVESATLEEMHGLFETLKAVYAAKEKAEVMKFRVGQKVTFMARGRMQGGVVTNLNETTVGVDVAGMKWRVSPQSLSVAGGK